MDIDWKARAEVERLGKALQQARQDASSRASVAIDRVQVLEENLARVLLLLHGLTETLIARGVLSREELHQTLAELDLQDGKADGQLAAASVPGMAQYTTPPTLHEALAQFARSPDSDPQDPKKFFQQLEQENG
jgi:hypothetical protein